VYTDSDGRFSFTTIRPGALAGSERGTQAPHLAVLVFTRGLLKPVATRMYFPADARNETDPILSRYVPPDRRQTLIARAVSPDAVSWTIVLQGSNETVFFEW
jgi:protocatechuate 3,4-dioxygenase alpha subunit